MYDLLIRHGRLVDGTGRAAFVADVAVNDGMIVAIGDLGAELATRVINADGLIVAPGFIDIHTHYDAQLFWDPLASPSSLHGVTTVIGGNCGFTLAPLAAADSDYIKRMMARVEGMTLDALDQGVAWDWTTYPEWLDRLDGAIAVNAGFLVGHSTIRRYVMGEAAVEREASPAEVDAMASLLAEGMAAGGLGFSTGLHIAHFDGDGNPVPSRHAGIEELLRLCAVVRSHPGTTVELVPRTNTRFNDDDVELMIRMSLAANRPLNWNLLKVTSEDPEGHNIQLAASTRAAERGARIIALLLSQSIRPRVSFLNGFVLASLPGWAKVLALPVDERLRALRDPNVLQQLRNGAASVEGDKEQGAQGLISQWGRDEIVETFAPENAGLEFRTLDSIAAERREDPFDTLIKIVLADDLRTGLMPAAVEDDEDSRRLRAQMWKDPRTVVGGSDAGAHVEMMCGATYTTRLFADAVRDRQQITVEEAVHQLTDVPARLYGLRGRGRVSEGWHADLVLFDGDQIGADPVRMRHDLPGGAPRLFAAARGIEHVFVNGVEIVSREGVTTEALPGRLVRSGRDTDTVTVPGG